MLGYRRQSYYKQQKDQAKRRDVDEQITRLVCRERKLLPKVGGRKLQMLLGGRLQQAGIKCGRDKLFSILRCAGLLIKPRKRYIQTTMSRHWMRKYPNLVKGQRASRPEQVWVGDITFVKTAEGCCYLSLITDAYSRKIMGYHLSDSLDAEQTRKAFEMALGHRQYPHRPLIHHSDRGHQYCSSSYVALAEQHCVRMSMTENSDPYENALAERMNRTIKEEFSMDNELPSKQLAVAMTRQAVELYNTYRPHLALGGKTPEQVHKKPQER